MADILQHAEVTLKEGYPLQKGMNFRPKNKNYSILLMSVRPDSPYRDGFDEKGTKLFYEGEDANRKEASSPKEFDQPMFSRNGKLSNNGKFFKAAEDFKLKRVSIPEKVQVYEKISKNVWADKGRFDLVDAYYSKSDVENRKVFKFILTPQAIRLPDKEVVEEFEFSRRIPTEVKRIVWERDQGKCSWQECESNKDLHFDHIIPWSKGGSSSDPKNIQILCGRHNLSKSDKIV
jgi:hypothetical protein